MSFVFPKVRAATTVETTTLCRTTHFLRFDLFLEPQYFNLQTDFADNQPGNTDAYF